MLKRSATSARVRELRLFYVCHQHLFQIKKYLILTEAYYLMQCTYSHGILSKLGDITPLLTEEFRLLYLTILVWSSLHCFFLIRLLICVYYSYNPIQVYLVYGTLLCLSLSCFWLYHKVDLSKSIVAIVENRQIILWTNFISTRCRCLISSISWHWGLCSETSDFKRGAQKGGRKLKRFQEGAKKNPQCVVSSNGILV